MEACKVHASLLAKWRPIQPRARLVPMTIDLYWRVCLFYSGVKLIMVLKSSHSHLLLVQDVQLVMDAGMMQGGAPGGMGMMGMQPPPTQHIPPAMPADGHMDPLLQGLPRELQHFAEMMPFQQVRLQIQFTTPCPAALCGHKPPPPPPPPRGSGSRYTDQCMCCSTLRR